MIAHFLLLAAVVAGCSAQQNAAVNILAAQEQAAGPTTSDSPSRVGAEAVRASPAPQEQKTPAPSQPTQFHTHEKTAGQSPQPGGDNDAASLLRLLADHQYSRVQEKLDAAQAEGTEIARGILLNRQNKSQESISVLEPLLAASAVTDSGDGYKAARLALAQDYLRLFQYAKAEAAFAEFHERYGANLSDVEKDEIELPLHLLPLMKTYTPQTVEVAGNFSVPFDRSPVGLIELTVFVKGYPGTWVFDPSATFNMISRSAAKSMGLKLSMETANVRSLTGESLTGESVSALPIAVRASLIPMLKIQQATFANVAVLVFEDGALDRSEGNVAGVVGFPLSSALGRVTLTANQRFEVDRGEADKSGARLYVEGKRLYAEAGSKGSERLFSVDPGVARSILTSRYYLEHVGELEQAGSSDSKNPAARDSTSQREKAAPRNLRVDSFTLLFGARRATFVEIELTTQPLVRDEHEDYGTLGADALEQLQTYSFDFRSMRISVTQLE